MKELKYFSNGLKVCYPTITQIREGLGFRPEDIADDPLFISEEVIEYILDNSAYDAKERKNSIEKSKKLLVFLKKEDMLDLPYDDCRNMEIYLNWVIAKLSS